MTDINQYIRRLKEKLTPPIILLTSSLTAIVAITATLLYLKMIPYPTALLLLGATAVPSTILLKKTRREAEMGQSLINLAFLSILIYDTIQPHTTRLQIPQSLTPDIIGFLFFLGTYFLLRHMELYFSKKLPTDGKRGTDRETIIVASLIRLAFIMPVVAFAVLLAFDFISLFHPNIETRIDEGLIAVTSSITALILEAVKKREN